MREAVRLVRLLHALTAACCGLLVASASAAAAPRQSTCGSEDFRCGRLTVPLDHSGAVAGSLRLRYAVRRSPRDAGVLVALSGGPGQPSVEAANSFAATLGPALARYRLVVLDQRGTGESGALNCPNVQGLRPLDPTTPEDVAACAGRIGPHRAFYSTADTVLDLDALRARLGADKVALMGVSYGTHVALQYARAFPERVDRLILDSVVGAEGLEPFLLDTYRNLPRVLREQCAGDACRNITRDPVEDVAHLVARLNQGPLRGTYFDDRGRRRGTLYRNPDELAFLLIEGDLNPFLQPALPAAISAARRGDTSLLMRLRRIAQGSRTELSDLSFGLHVTTMCADAPLPYSLLTPLPERAALAQQALAAIDPAQYAPFDPQTVLRTSPVGDCLLWPNDQTRPPFAGPLPDVPALLLGGRLDLRTPIENAEATAGQLPRASVVALPGAGHYALGNDVSGCTRRALERFIGDRPVGNPCAGRDNAFDPFPRPPRGIRDFRSAPGVGGSRGRTLFAVLDTVGDAAVTALQLAGAELAPRGGGLHGGWFTAPDPVLRLRAYSYVPGVRVTGALEAAGAGIRGRLSVRGPRGSSGFLRLDGRGGVSGRLGGRSLRYPAGRGRAGTVRGAAARRAAWTRRSPHGPQQQLRRH